ncbi:hypothetical protein PR048_030230 [Dryococelus australis]|uniref:Uncharacterized protein n=1 Tax=Dryococelus australis TaxID=614101 RepID=A0ABQ9GB17_9NEOP|nr:hypothetical protein PR048_030230 [Dryococelus australis]
MAGEYQSCLAGMLNTTPFSQWQGKAIPNLHFLSPKDSQIRNDLLTIVLLESAAVGKNIRLILHNTLESFCAPIRNCIALGCDNALASVMISHKDGVAAVVDNRHKNGIVMTCACHLLHLAAEKGSTGLHVNVDEDILDVYILLFKEKH